MVSWAIGDLRVDRIEEFCEPVIPLFEFLTDLPADAIERNRSWLEPGFVDPHTGLAIMADHSWVVRTPRHAILIDSCWGNGKPRPGFGGNLNTPWLQRLQAIGLRPEDIDFVMCTHLHADHVGWNTRLVDGRWVPTFPNARYLFGRKEYDYWSHADNALYGHDAAFQDSVLPCIGAGLAQLVDGGYMLDDTVLMEDAPGHTVGNMVIKARSGDCLGLFSGDVVHVPLQLTYPHANSVVCDLPEIARATRRRLLEECAEGGWLIFPGHFPAPYCGRVGRDGDAFRFIA